MVLAELQRAVITRKLSYGYRANPHMSELMDKGTGNEKVPVGLSKIHIS